MTKVLWLLRHCKALPDPPPGGRDRDRRLSTAGSKAAAELRGALVAGALGLPEPERVLTSPARRTQATAQGVFAERAEIFDDARLYHATPDDVLEIIRELPDEISCAAIVGHNPTIHCLSLDMVSEIHLERPHPGATSYPPGTLSVIELPIESWAKAAFGEGVLRCFR